MTYIPHFAQGAISGFRGGHPAFVGGWWDAEQGEDLRLEMAQAGPEDLNGGLFEKRVTNGVAEEPRDLFARGPVAESLLAVDRQLGDGLSPYRGVNDRSLDSSGYMPSLLQS